MVGSVVAWVASKLFFGGNKGAVNTGPALIVIVLVGLLAYGAGSLFKGWSKRSEIKSLTTKVVTLTAELKSERESCDEARAKAEADHLAAIVERDRAHAEELQRQSVEIAEARRRAIEAATRFDNLNNQLVRIQSEAPSVACTTSARRLQLLDQAASAANGSGTGKADPAPNGRR
jgi:hypothetical protein